MFVAQEVVVPVELGTARDRLTGLIHGNGLAAASRDSYDAGVWHLLRVGPLGITPERDGDTPNLRAWVSKLVKVQYRDLVSHGDSVVLTLRWEATGSGNGLFPALDADVTLSAAGQDTTKMRLDGSYRPPFGTLGARLDRAVLHRIADSTIDSFVATLAHVISPDGAHGPAAAEPGPPDTPVADGPLA